LVPSGTKTANLLNTMSDETIHIAIIPDGNRRWAKGHKLHPWDGHKKALKNFHTLTEWCDNDSRVSVLTIWCFSTENWKRNPKEIEMLMQLLEKYLTNEKDQLMEKGTRLIHSGRKDRIPESLAKLIGNIEEESKGNTGLTLHLTLDYGGCDEVVRAIQRMENTKDATEESVREHLDHPELPDIDLVVRTSGEKRTSNFFLWQSTYSEWAFVDKKFPEFTAEDLAKEVNTFAERSRRFGG